MKKILFNMLVITLLLTGCNQTKDNEENIKTSLIPNISFIIQDINENEPCDEALQTIYVQDGYTYSYPCIKSDKVFIIFEKENIKMTLQEALEKKLITIELVIDKYPNILIKEKIK